MPSAGVSQVSVLINMQSYQTVSTPNQLAVVPPRQQSVAAPSKFRARWVELDELRSRVNAWESLAQNSLTTNVAFEPNFLLPALEHLGSKSVRVLIVEDVQVDHQSNLIGLVPIESKSVYRLPFKAAEIWKHDQCYDSTPLLHSQYADQAWGLICKKLKDERFCLLSLDTVSGEPDVDRIFRATEQEQGIARFQRDRFERTAFRPSETVEDYVKEHVPKSICKKNKRLFRRLGEIGTVTWEVSDDFSDFDQLAQEFLRIEGSGWKGRAGTALISTASTKAFFQDMIRKSAKVGKVRFLSLMLDGRPVATLCDIQSGQYVYCYKTAYDEKFGKFSPGQQIETKNIEYLYRNGVTLGDSCALASNSTINRVWGQKLIFQNLILSLTPSLARVAVKSLPVIQSVVHRLRKN